MTLLFNKKIFKLLFKSLCWIVLSIVAFLLLVFLCIDPIAKYVIEKYDTSYLGREITIHELDINIFTASVEIIDFKLFEKDKKTTFVSFTKFYTQTDYIPLIKNKIQFYPIEFDGLYVNIKNKNGKLNFSDIIEKLNSGKNSEKSEIQENEKSKPLSILLQNFSINNGSFVYTDGDRNIHYWLSNYVLKVPEYNSEIEKIKVLLQSNFNKVAKLNVDLNYDIKKQFYDVNLDLKNFPIKHIDSYLKEVLRFNSLTAFLDASLIAHGNTKTANNFSVSGDVSLNNFDFIDAYSQKLIAFEKLKISVDSLNISNNLYKVNSVTLTKPFVLFEMYNNGNSFNRLLIENNVAATSIDTTVKTTAVENAPTNGNVFLYVYQYFKQVSTDILLSSYSANKLQIDSGYFVYNDFSLGEKMNIEASDFNLHTSRISSSSDSISAYVTSTLNKIGNLKIDYSADAKNFKDMAVNIDIQKFPMTTFNAYSKYYTGFPFKKGGLTINNSIKISENILDSKTAILLEKTYAGRKDKIIRQNKIPLKLLLTLLRDKKQNIDIEMPVSGNLNDPNYKLAPIILKILKNLMVKTISAPANLIGCAFSKNDMSEIVVESNYLEFEPSAKLKNSLSKLKELLIEKPDLVTEINYVNDTLKEKELLILKVIKKMYLQEEKQMDSLSITDNHLKKIVPTDSLFNAYINKKVEGRVKTEQSVFVKSLHIIGTEQLQNQYHQIETIRLKKLTHFIETELNEVKARVKIITQSIDKNILNPNYILSLDGVD